MDRIPLVLDSDPDEWRYLRLSSCTARSATAISSSNFCFSIIIKFFKDSQVMSVGAFQHNTLKRELDVPSLPNTNPTTSSLESLSAETGKL